jgi:hypothetical protein
VENAAAMEIRSSIGGLRQLLLDADSHSAWKSLAKALGFSTFTTGPATIHQYGTNVHLKNYKGWLRDQEDFGRVGELRTFPPRRTGRADFPHPALM